MARVKVIEPATGHVVEVDSDSPLASLWRPADEKKAPAKRASSSKSSK